MKEPEYRDKIIVFDTTYQYLGTHGQEIHLWNPNEKETQMFGYWEFVEGRIATGES